MRQVLFINDQYYILFRKIRKSLFTELSHVNDYKNFLHVNHVLQDTEFYLFCETVDDIQFEEIITQKADIV